MGRLEAHRLGLGSQGQLGLRLSRPAQAKGLSSRVGRLGSGPSRVGFILGRVDPWAAAAGGLLLHASWAASAPPPLADVLVPHDSLGGIWCGVVWIQCRGQGCVRVRVGAGACGKKPQRLGRDANATSRPRRGWTRTARPWRGHGEAGPRRRAAARLGCARTRAGPGILGPRRGRAVRGAPVPRARGTTRRR
jgi:hypothetical protein